jgi:glycosyltransferase involved in cell wall biosynthesis
VLLKKTYFPEAKVEYFLHSYPVEGAILTGYNAYRESIDTHLAQTKLAREKEWMQQSDVVVPVGAFLRAGALKLLGGAKVRVHECIGGTEVDGALVTYTAPGDTATLLFNGRANAPIKGLEDILLAAAMLRDDETWRTPFKKIQINVRYWGDKTYRDGSTVDIGYVQSFANGIVKPDDPQAHRPVTVTIKGGTPDIMAEVRGSHAVMMPSYIEHFGLVPIEALGVGVPVLVNEVSGAGMFLGDPKRFGTLGQECVVHDFHKRISPSAPDDFLEPRNIPRDAFDNRPHAWANAIKALLDTLAHRFEGAHSIGTVLRESYLWTHCAKGVVDAAGIAYAKSPVTQQGPKGVIWDINGERVV